MFEACFSLCSLYNRKIIIVKSDLLTGHKEVLSGGLLSLRQVSISLGGFSCYLIKTKTKTNHICSTFVLESVLLKFMVILFNVR